MIRIAVHANIRLAHRVQRECGGGAAADAAASAIAVRCSANECVRVRAVLDRSIIVLLSVICLLAVYFSTDTHV